MRKNVAYVGAELALYDECMRVVPAIAKMRAQSRFGDSLALLENVHRTSDELGVAKTMTWSILCAAYMAWTQAMFESAAVDEHIPVVELIDRAIASAVDWVAQ